MGLLKRIEWEDRDILLTLRLTKKEYENINSDTKEFIVMPADNFDRVLTTGKLGNGNRIMVPSKFLKNNNIAFLKKNVRSSIVDVEERKFLVIELDNKRTGVPVFGED